jgi:DNA/RNA-binding domain of Phe-tRNA-synthetase-like protein
VPLRWALDHEELVVGWVLAEGVEVARSDGRLAAQLDAAIGRRSAEGLDEGTRAAVRDLLRGHGYKPTGRGKPASEFLVRAAASGSFPRISNVVDINNLVSLETGLPISVFDLDRALGSAAGLEIRRGASEESFVFNPAGQRIDIGGLPGVARIDAEAVGNPVKDSMLAKVGPETKRVLAVIYGSLRVGTAESMRSSAARFATLIRDHAGATSLTVGVLQQG